MAEASCISAGDRISAPTPAHVDPSSSNVPDLGGSAVEIADRPIYMYHHPGNGWVWENNVCSGLASVVSVSASGAGSACCVCVCVCVSIELLLTLVLSGGQVCGASPTGDCVRWTNSLGNSRYHLAC